MCGLVGAFFPRDQRPVDQTILARMIAQITHRGPDDTGYHLLPGYGVGFCRLSIVDLSGGHQPMTAADGRVVSAVNGELYNHTELRTALQAKGHSFQTRCDVEVVPALYLEHGAEFAEHLSGQFACAVYDAARRELVLARDQVGIAPLFWTEWDGGYLFASEIKALLAWPGLKKQVNLTALDQIMTFPGPVSPHTMFKGIYSLKPGERLVISERGVEARQYWDLDYPREADLAPIRPVESYLEDLDGLLRQAVQRRLQGDVPAALYLSGGLDSSLVAAVTHAVAPGEQRDTFSIIFDDKEINERDFQLMMSRHLGTRHHERLVTPDDILGHLKEIVVRAETPLRESYNACSLILSRMVREAGMKLVLSGEGADELFAGYVGYRLDADRQQRLDPDDTDDRMEIQFNQRLWDAPHFFYEKRYRAHADIRAEIYAEGPRAQFRRFQATATSPIDRQKMAGRHPMHQRSYLDFKLRMADHLLSDHGDRVIMGNSVEGRYPFLDQDLIDYVRTMPPHVLVQDGIEKAPLKALARRYLPSDVIDRRKFSFVAPASPDMLRRNLDWVNDLLSPARIARQGYFDPDMVEGLRQMYTKPGFRLNQTYEDDLLMVILTFNILVDAFDLPDYAG